MKSTGPRVALIIPTALDSSGRPIKEGRLHLPALTLPALAAITPPHVNLRLIYETVEDIPYDEPWDLVGLTGMGSGIVRAWQIGDEFRKRGVKVAIGGIAASTGKPEWTLEHADTLIIGEAEELWPRVLEDFQANRLRSVYRMERRPPIDQIPVPRYDLMNRWKMGLWRPVQATRGCPFTCNFCSITSFFEAGYRKRPVEQVVRDVRAAKRHGTHYIAFIDDNIGVDFDYCQALWEALIPEKIIWMSQCSLHLSERPEMMKLAHRSGCRLISVGIESTNRDSLKAIDKVWNRPERYAEAIADLRRHGIEISTEMIIGLDGDDETVFDRAYDFVMNNRIAVPRVHILTPIPGTPLYDDLARQGRIRSHEFSGYTGSKVVYQPLGLDPDLLQTGYWRLYERLFSWRSIVTRLIPQKAGLGPYMRAVLWAANIRYRGHIQARISPGIL